MTCKAIHKRLCILVTNMHSDRKFIFFNSCSLYRFFFQDNCPYYSNMPRIVFLSSPNISIHAYATQSHLFCNFHSSISKYF